MVKPYFFLLAPGVRNICSDWSQGAQALGKEFSASAPWVIQWALKFPQSHDPNRLNSRKRLLEPKTSEFMARPRVLWPLCHPPWGFFAPYTSLTSNPKITYISDVDQRTRHNARINQTLIAWTRSTGHKHIKFYTKFIFIFFCTNLVILFQ